MKRVGLDTNVFMSIFLEEANRVEPSLALLRLIMNGEAEGIVSGVTLVEVAVLFMQKGAVEKAQKAVNLIRNLPNATIVDLTPDMALDIAELKISEKLSIADAAVLSASTGLRADVFLTYDDDFRNVKRIQCMSPEQYLSHDQ